MREEYNSVLLTPSETDKISCFSRYRYISKTQISADYVGLSLIKNFPPSLYNATHSAAVVVAHILPSLPDMLKFDEFFILFTSELLHEARISHASNPLLFVITQEFFQIKKFHKLNQRCLVA